LKLFKNIKGFVLDNLICGKNSVVEAILSGEKIEKIFLQNGFNKPANAKILKLLAESEILTKYLPKAELDRISKNLNHQGIVASAAPFRYSSVEEILALAKKKSEPPFIIICEGITDERNLGAILRTANAAGCHGLIIPKNRSAEIGLSARKTSSGAAEYAKVAKVTNISRTIDELKIAGIFTFGTDLAAAQAHFDADFRGPIAIVIGSEDKGISRLTREKVDFLVKIPMLGEIESLNASVAAGIIIYEAVRQRMAE
jgi:23S rRNA (guanosine2251-2'-O)-methyltransferase